MASAREILEERLAKGEITPDQFDELLSRISARSVKDSSTNAVVGSTPVAATNQASPIITEGTNKKKWLIIAGACVFVWVIAINLISEISGGLSLSGASAYENIVNLTLTNNSEKSGYAAVRVSSKDNNTNYCRIAIAIKPNTTRTVKFECSEAEIVIPFGVSAVWADNNLARSLPRLEY